MTVFEQSDGVGGLWVYEEEVETDPLGQRPERRIHGSLYASLTTNLPRDLMAFDGYTFDSAGGGADDWPRYPGHLQVAEYLRRFSHDCDINRRIRFGHRVACIAPEGQGWRIDNEPFDAVAVCNGHFSEPLVPSLPGLDDFPGTALHSHNYRRPEPFAGKRVLVFGSSVSGADLARELASVGAVHFSGRAFTQTMKGKDGIVRCPSVVRLEGTDATLANGAASPTSTPSSFAPAITTACHSFHPSRAVACATTGCATSIGNCSTSTTPPLPSSASAFRIVPFPFFQRQARWFARLLAGAFELPSRTERRAALARQLRCNRSAGIAERHFHRLEDTQIDYLNELARQCGDEPMPAWFGELWREHKANTLARPGHYQQMPLKAHGPTVVP